MHHAIERSLAGRWSTSCRMGAMLAAGAALSMPATAQVAASSMQLVFSQPTGTVSPTASIPINVRLTNLDPAHAFGINASLPNFGLDPSMLPSGGSWFDSGTGQSGTSSFASYSGVSFTLGFGCSGTFTTSCTSGPPYNYSFANLPFTYPNSLAPGASLDYLFGTFTPSAGPVASGTYSFYRSVLIVVATGHDAAGHVLTGNANAAQTCSFDTAAACAGQSIFTRTVSAVPEPATWPMLGAGVAALLGLRARRRR